MAGWLLSSWHWHRKNRREQLVSRNVASHRECNCQSPINWPVRFDWMERALHWLSVTGPVANVCSTYSTSRYIERTSFQPKGKHCSRQSESVGRNPFNAKGLSLLGGGRNRSIGQWKITGQWLRCHTWLVKAEGFSQPERPLARIDQLDSKWPITV